MEIWDEFQVWMGDNESLLVWGVAISALTFVGSLVAVPLAVIWMRPDYFLESSRSGVPRTPLAVVRHILKNVLGGVLLLVGVAMLFLPGQGLLTMLLGLSLVDFPGKRPLQLRLLRLKGIRRSVEWIRNKAEKEPLEIPESD